MTQDLTELVLGTRNRKKGQELAELLAPHRLPVQTLAEIPHSIEVVEDGDSFAANAERKAVQQALHLKAWVLGEDSGLCVEALNGAPGVLSARYSGEQATDATNNAKLLAALDGLPWERRSAHYVCHMVLSDPDGQIRARSEGICRGRLRSEPAGTGGFGYDPLFEILEYHLTFGELGAAVKSVISHRSRAMRLFLPQLLALVG